MPRLGLGIGVAGIAHLTPANKTAPALSTTSPVHGTSLSVTNGTWTMSPTSYTYQWYGAGSPIAGATAASYTPVVGDVGHTLRCVVSAHSPQGVTAASSNTSSAVT